MLLNGMQKENPLPHLYVVKSHEMDSLWGHVRNSRGHIITLFEKYF